MDTLNYILLNEKLDNIISELSKIQIEKSFLETYSTVIVALIVGLFAGIISLYIGRKQIKAITVNSITLKSIDSCRDLINKTFRACEESIYLVSSGNIDNDLFIKHYAIHGFLDELEILTNTNDEKHRDFIKSIRDYSNDFMEMTKTKSLKEVKANWSKCKKNILSKFHGFINHELRKM